MTNPEATKTLPISVVIATLGGDVLGSTIAHLNQGGSRPAEILVCIPESAAARADCVAEVHNVRIIKTKCQGQVAQRAVGLSVAAHPYVMQLDDDVILLSNTLEGLYTNILAKGVGNIVAPFFRIQRTGDVSTRYVGGLRGFLRNCHASFVCGAPFGRKRLGRISSSGIGFGVPMSLDDCRVIESEWLPGGVALCHKEDVIANDYYPFEGKAFSEDLIHSILWRRQGCRLWTVLDVSAMIDVTIESLEWNSVMGRYRAHAYVAELLGGRIWRTRLWLIVYCLKNMRNLMAQNFANKMV